MKITKGYSVVVVLVIGITAGSTGLAATCDRDMPSITENALGDNSSINGDSGRTAADMAHLAANYFFFGGGRKFSLDFVHPNFAEAIGGNDGVGTWSDLYETAICNERGSCGRVFIQGEWDAITEVSTQIFIWSATEDVGLKAENYHIQAQFLGQTFDKEFSVDSVTQRFENAKASSSYEPRYSLPDGPESPLDLRCRDSDGDLVGGDDGSSEGGGKNSPDGDGYDTDFYDDFWDAWWEEEEAYGGRVWACRENEDPYDGGVICT